jgi:hypothetical protein
MNEPMMNDILAVVRWPAADRLGLLMDRVKPADLTTQEILAPVAVFCDVSGHRAHVSWGIVHGFVCGW